MAKNPEKGRNPFENFGRQFININIWASGDVFHNPVLLVSHWYSFEN
jgi:hypothetical protein